MTAEKPSAGRSPAGSPTAKEHHVDDAHPAKASPVSYGALRNSTRGDAVNAKTSELEQLLQSLTIRSTALQGQIHAKATLAMSPHGALQEQEDAGDADEPELGDASGEQRRLREENSALQTQLEELRAECTSLRSQLRDAVAQGTSTMKERDEHCLRTEQLEAEVDVLRAQMDAHRSIMKESEDALVKQSNEIERLMQEVKDAHERSRQVPQARVTDRGTTMTPPQPSPLSSMQPRATRQSPGSFSRPSGRSISDTGQGRVAPQQQPLGYSHRYSGTPEGHQQQEPRATQERGAPRISLFTPKHPAAGEAIPSAEAVAWPGPGRTGTGVRDEASGRHPRADERRLHLSSSSSTTCTSRSSWAPKQTAWRIGMGEEDAGSSGGGGGAGGNWGSPSHGAPLMGSPVMSTGEPPHGTRDVEQETKLDPRYAGLLRSARELTTACEREARRLESLDAPLHHRVAERASRSLTAREAPVTAAEEWAAAAAPFMSPGGMEGPQQSDAQERRASSEGARVPLQRQEEEDGGHGGREAASTSPSPAAAVMGPDAGRRIRLRSPLPNPAPRAFPAGAHQDAATADAGGAHARTTVSPQSAPRELSSAYLLQRRRGKPRLRTPTLSET